jgi:hypothetical protein
MCAEKSNTGGLASRQLHHAVATDTCLAELKAMHCMMIMAGALVHSRNFHGMAGFAVLL